MKDKAIIERPISNPFVLKDEYLMMIPLMPAHMDILWKKIFSQAHVMKYFARGKSFTFDEYTPIHLGHARKNLTGSFFQFTWTIITHDGIAGRLRVFPSEDGRTEITFFICPDQSGRGLARRASELFIQSASDNSSFIATAHPSNKASLNTLEKIKYSNGEYVFFKDKARQNVPDVYGKNQPRNYFLSHKKGNN